MMTELAAMLAALSQMARVRRSIEDGLKDRRAGRMRPWEDVRRDLAITGGKR